MIISQNSTTANSSKVLELNNVPAGLIYYAVTQWLPCQKYAYKTGVGNNTNPFIKAVSTWLILKAQYSSGNIQNYRGQLPALAAGCKISVRTLQARLSYLTNEGLVHVKDKALYLHTYRELRKYSIDTYKKEKTIFYDTENETKLEEVLIAIVMQRMKDRWMAVYWKKVNANPDKYGVLYDLLIRFGADAGRLKDPEYFRECHLELMLQSFNEDRPGLSIPFQILHERIEANPDLNCKAATYGRRWGYTIQEKENARTQKDESCCSGFTHLKKKLAKKGLITIVKDHIDGLCKARKDEKIFHHRWNRKTQTTIWFRVDQITINQEQFFKPKGSDFKQENDTKNMAA